MRKRPHSLSRAARAVRHARKRLKAFTLIELLIVIAIMGILAAGIMYMLNPFKNKVDAMDSVRKLYARELEKAMIERLIDTSEVLQNTQIPVGQANARSICRYGVNNPLCVNLDDLIPTYIATLPEDPGVKDATVTGFKIYKTEHGFIKVEPSHLGKLADAESSSSAAGGGSSSLPSGLIATIATDDGPYYIAAPGDGYMYANHYSARTMRIYDIGNPAAPAPRGTLPMGGDALRNLKVSGDYAYIALADNDSDASQFHVADIADRSAPAIIGSYAMPGFNSIKDLSVDGDYAYVVAPNNNRRLQVMDIAVKTAPTRIIETAVGGVRNDRIVQRGDHVLVTTNIPSPGEALRVWYVGNPADPIYVAEAVDDGNPGGMCANPFSVAAQGNHAYVACSDELLVYDISALPTSLPTVNPPLLSSTPLALSDSAHVLVQGNRLYLSSSLSNKFQIFDISDPVNPSLIIAYDTGSTPRDLAVTPDGKLAFLANFGDDTIMAFNIEGL